MRRDVTGCKFIKDTNVLEGSYSFEQDFIFFCKHRDTD